MRSLFLSLLLPTSLLALQLELTKNSECDVIVSDDLEYDCQESIDFFGQFVLDTDSVEVDSIKLKGIVYDKAEGYKLYKWAY